MDKLDVIKAGIFGVVVGDALGVPVEFTSRWERKRDPVTGMREYGTHNQPKGTWSDDSSMMLATMDSMNICDGIDYADIMRRFRSWEVNGEYTPFGSVFDIGITCARAVSNFRPGVDPLQCGLSGERDNGNGSLMRIMPISLYDAMREDFWEEEILERCADDSHNASRLTHAHPRSRMGCMIYTALCHELIFRGERTVKEAVSTALTNIKAFYAKRTGACGEADFAKEIASDPYRRMWDVDSFATLPDEEIKSSGYVVHTLEAAVWCLLNTDTFAECTLKAVNLGDDTDTVGAVAGGLAGLAYGYAGIPKEWLDVIEKRTWIEGLCNDFGNLSAFD